MMIYVLAAGSTTYPVDHLAYTTMKSKSAVGTYGSADPFIMTYAGTLFTYQFSHSWIDFRNRSDSFGTNWFTNSVNASIAAHDYAVALGTQYKTFSDVSWGATASDGPDGYNGRYGSRPSMYNNSGHYVDGTLAPCGAVGSIAFTPELSIGAIEHYATIPALQSKYGFRDAYNLGLQPNAPAYVVRPTRLIPLSGWFDPYVLGLDKGVGLLMIENYRSGMVWEFFMRSEIVQRGMQELGINEIL
jgi:hypothetical protein